MARALSPRHFLTRDELTELVHLLNPRRPDYTIESQETLGRLWCFMTGQQYVRMSPRDGLVYTNHRIRDPNKQYIHDSFHDAVLDIDQVLGHIESNDYGSGSKDLLPREPYRPIVSEIKYWSTNDGQSIYYHAQLYAFRHFDLENPESFPYPHTVYGYGRTRALACVAAVLENHKSTADWRYMNEEDAKSALAKSD